MAQVVVKGYNVYKMNCSCMNLELVFFFVIKNVEKQD